MLEEITWAGRSALRSAIEGINAPSMRASFTMGGIVGSIMIGQYSAYICSNDFFAGLQFR
jgi:hypothetical protein